MALWLCELFQLTERERYCAGTLVLDTWYCGLTFWTSSSTGGWGCSRSDTSSKICKRMSRKMALCVDMIWGCTPVTFLVPATLTHHTDLQFSQMALTNERPVLSVLTNERPVLSGLTNERSVLSLTCSLGCPHRCRDTDRQTGWTI